jgi:hypothetical protein
MAAAASQPRHANEVDDVLEYWKQQSKTAI